MIVALSRAMLVDIMDGDTRFSFTGSDNGLVHMGAPYIPFSAVFRQEGRRDIDHLSWKSLYHSIGHLPEEEGQYQQGGL